MWQSQHVSPKIYFRRIQSAPNAEDSNKSKEKSHLQNRGSIRPLQQCSSPLRAQLTCLCANLILVKASLTRNAFLSGFLRFELACRATLASQFPCCGLLCPGWTWKTNVSVAITIYKQAGIGARDACFAGAGFVPTANKLINGFIVKPEATVASSRIRNPRTPPCDSKVYRWSLIRCQHVKPCNLLSKKTFQNNASVRKWGVL